MIRPTYRPLSSRAWLRASGRRTNVFRATLAATRELLASEVRTLGSGEFVIGLDAAPSELRLDGTGLRARAYLASPAVEVAFDSRFGPMLYRCDTYTTWPRTVVAGRPSLVAMLR